MQFLTGRTHRLWLVTSGLIVVLVLAAVLVSGQSRRELMQLTVNQGKVLIEAIAQILKSEVAAAEQRDRQDAQETRRTTALLWDQLPRTGGGSVASLVANQQNVALIAMIDQDSIKTTYIQREGLVLPEIIISTALDLFRRPDTNFLSVQVTDSFGVNSFYLERSNDSRYILILGSPEVEQSGQSEMLDWVRQLELDSTLSFVSWETSEKSIITSRQYLPPDSLITQMLDSVSRGDLILNLQIERESARRLEIYRPFSSTTHPRGVLRLALPLSAFDNAVARSDRQVLLTTLLAVLVVLVGSAVIALRGRRKEQEEAFQTLRGLFSNVLNSLELGVMVVDQKGNIRLSNEWMQLRLDQKISEEENVNSLGADFVKLLGESASSVRTATTGKDGRRRWLQATRVPISISSDQTGTLIFVHDQTAMQEAETRLRRQERVAELGELAAGVAHDIRNPLHTISLGLQQLIGAPADAHAEIISLLRSEVGRINLSIARFLSLTKEQPLQFQSTNVRQLVEERVSAWLPRALHEQKRIEIQGVRELSVSVDSGRLRDVLDNLICNALEAVQTAGGIVHIEIVGSDKGWGIHIDDNGAGVSDTHRELLFSPGFTTKESGTGIGLALVEKNMREMGGEVSIARSPLGGARFTLTFPK